MEGAEDLGWTGFDTKSDVAPKPEKGVAFTAITINVETDCSTPKVTLARTGPPDHKLEFVRTLDGVVGTCDGLGRFTTLVNVLLTPKVIAVRFSGRREFVVRHHAAGEKLRALRKGLKTVFRGTGLFVDDSVTGWALFDAIVSGPPTPTSEMLVVPTYMTIVGCVLGAICAGAINPWLTPLGLLPGAAFGFLWGMLMRGRFYHMHKYQ